ncbi:MAG TPA: hypothetical protein VHF05_01545, partial [Candidatus Paceibacterota bacterium]|nr:hypothetical protein [Candidatus Paceibacterota bacterium]
PLPKRSGFCYMGLLTKALTRQSDRRIKIQEQFHCILKEYREHMTGSAPITTPNIEEAAEKVKKIAHDSDYNPKKVTEEDKNFLRTMAQYSARIMRLIRKQFDFRATWRKLMGLLQPYGWPVTCFV